MDFYDKFMNRLQDPSKKQKNKKIKKMELSICFGEYDVVILSILYLKVLIIWFDKILQLFFQKQPPCPRNICTEY